MVTTPMTSEPTTWHWLRDSIASNRGNMDQVLKHDKHKHNKHIGLTKQVKITNTQELWTPILFSSLYPTIWTIYNILNWQIYMLKQSWGVIFSEVAEAPQAATTRRTGLGITIWCQNSVKGRLWVRIVGQNRVKGIFWVSPIYLLYLMEHFE